MNALGITEKEFEIYKTLLRNGASTISFLANKAGLDQRSTYDYIERLINKGLVGQIMHNNKRMFLGLNPEMMEYLVEEEKKSINDKFTALNELSSVSGKGVLMNLISSKSDFLKIIKGTKAESVFIGGKCKEVEGDPNFKYFIKKNNPESINVKSNASVIVVFGVELFLIYSVPEKKGFFVNDVDFVENMKVYFLAK